MLKKLLLLLVVSCAVWAAEAAPRGLELQLELADAAQPAFRLFIVNHDTVPHQVVKTGDGSESAWREPAMRWTGEVQEENGRWVPMPLKAFGRCGLYDADWHKDVVTLKPGERLELGPYATYPTGFNMPKHGKVRLTASYVYTAGAIRKGAMGAVDPGPMAGVAPFTLTSQPLEFTRQVPSR